MAGDHFIFMVDGSSYRPMYEHMLADIAKREDVSIVVDAPAGGAAKELLLKNKVRKLTNGCLDFLGYEENRLYDYLKTVCPSHRDVYVVFLNSALWHNPYLPGTLKRYKQKWKNIKYVLFYLDVIGSGVCRTADLLREQHVFDLVYSYDANNAKDYHLIPWRTFYSQNEYYKNIPVQSQLYFCCGVTGPRIPLLRECLEQCRKNKIHCTMDLICNEPAEELRQYVPMANLLPAGHELNYASVLQRELSASCLLEIVQPGRTGLTLRPYEAVAYNRKLLTNCKSILDFPYYNPTYMQYFENIENIDWEWVKADVTVDYGYNEEFSPEWLLEDIQSRLG